MTATGRTWQRPRCAGFRCSCNVFGLSSRADFAETCRRVERAGYDTIFSADHLGVASPFPVLVAAAAATERLRVGTLVLNAPFWNPALLAKARARAGRGGDRRPSRGSRAAEREVPAPHGAR